jgi:hypothetical protein
LPFISLEFFVIEKNRFLENKIYFYGILDGFNGTFAVDLIEQFLAAYIYLDHLIDLNSI